MRAEMAPQTRDSPVVQETLPIDPDVAICRIPSIGFGEQQIPIGKRPPLPIEKVNLQLFDRLRLVDIARMRSQIRLWPVMILPSYRRDECMPERVVYAFGPRGIGRQRGKEHVVPVKRAGVPPGTAFDRQGPEPVHDVTSHFRVTDLQGDLSTNGRPLQRLSPIGRAPRWQQRGTIDMDERSLNGLHLPGPGKRDTR